MMRFTLFFVGALLGAAGGYTTRGLTGLATWRIGYHAGVAAADSAIQALEAKPVTTPNGVPVWRAVFGR